MTNTIDSTDTRSRGVAKKGLGIGLAVGLLGGTAAGLVLGVPGSSSAADDASGAPATAAFVRQVDDVPADDAAAEATRERGDRLRNVLQSLVDDGTIDSTQADAVTAHLVENRRDWVGRRGPGRFVARSGVVTDLLGIDAAELRAELRAGSTLADIATEQGVAVEDLVEAIVAQLQERVDAAVESGRITADEAAERLAQAEERITAKINGESLADD